MAGQYGRAALASVRETAAGMTEAGVTIGRTMKAFDKLCLTPVEDTPPDRIRKSGVVSNASQAVFARHLNVSPAGAGREASEPGLAEAPHARGEERSRVHCVRSRRPGRGLVATARMRDETGPGPRNRRNECRGMRSGSDGIERPGAPGSPGSPEERTARRPKTPPSPTGGTAPRSLWRQVCDGAPARPPPSQSAALLFRPRSRIRGSADPDASAETRLPAAIPIANR